MGISTHHQMDFTNRIRKDDERPAIISDGEILSYGRLRDRIDHYADVLAFTGAEAGTTVALSLERGPDAVAAMLATVETGAAFVWLDGAQPAARNRTVLADSGAVCLVTDAGGRGDGLVRDLAGPDLAVVQIDGTATAAVERLGRRRGPRAVPEDTAVIVYTSGSTGTPKGIVQRRVNIDEFTRWFSAEVGMTERSKVLQWAQFVYDASYVEIFSAIGTGATLVMPPPAVKADVHLVLDWIRRHGVTHIQTAPSLYRALFDALTATDGHATLDALRGITIAGEALSPALAQEARRVFPNADLFNMYGPAECILATYHRITENPGDSRTVPIGIPLPGREVLLCHEDGTLVPDGEIGEIRVRSRFLVHGYLHRPEETERAFLADPHGEPGFRVYRTGDLAARRPDGTLVFEGRIDDQVKIRGVRVELGEIEVAVAELPGVLHAAVVPVDGGTGDRQLCAYVQPREPGALSPAELRSALAARLPHAMVPARFVLIDAMPLTVSGKVDKRTLRATAQDPATADRTPDARPAELSATQRKVAGIWSNVLGVAADSPEADFFALGGDSLNVPRVRRAVAETFGLDVPLAAFYEYPGIEQLARHLDELLAADRPAAVTGSAPAPLR
ncbi:non-ribosomal peptide synthetase [Streptomyces sp. CB02959]|uniref:non-ribosomal peptide synthetase n=1 Tax=Streptomyces sp. CB02959 TaxID=2020330 RepID=UPI0015E1150F|nr:non-ribosomal peptide synthetase [Streptomyces sp. CB02959]